MTIVSPAEPTTGESEVIVGIFFDFTVATEIIVRIIAIMKMQESTLTKAYFLKRREKVFLMLKISYQLHLGFPSFPYYYRFHGNLEQKS